LSTPGSAETVLLRIGSPRLGAAQKIASGGQRAGLVDEDRARQLAASLAKTSGCGSCDSCGACGTADAKQPADKTATSVR